MKTELIKQTFRLGNSAGIILPKEWENKKVRVQLIRESINKDVFEILEKRKLLEDVVGIYLAGSYARGEETPESDIDILVITNEKNMQIKEGNYEIVLISADRFSENFKKNLYIISLVRESKTILNNILIEKYKKITPQISFKKHLDEIKSIIKIHEDSVEFAEEYNQKVLDGTAYSIILRLRELYLINSLVENKILLNKEFLKLINSLDAISYYEAYLRVKNDRSQKNNLSVSTAKKLLNLTKRLIKDLENGKKK